MKWPKTKIRLMTSALDSFHTCNRPLDYRGMEAFNEKFSAYLAEHRLELVVAGITSNRDISKDRAQKNRETADHFENHPNIYGSSTPEMVERFRGFAKDEDRAALYLEKLLEQIQSEGLPQEVLDHDPAKRH